MSITCKKTHTDVRVRIYKAVISYVFKQTDRSLVQNSALTLQRVDVHSNCLHVALQIICTFPLISKQNSKSKRDIASFMLMFTISENSHACDESKQKM